MVPPMCHRNVGTPRQCLEVVTLRISHRPAVVSDTPPNSSGLV